MDDNPIDHISILPENPFLFKKAHLKYVSTTGERIMTTDDLFLLFVWIILRSNIEHRLLINIACFNYHKQQYK